MRVGQTEGEAPVSAWSRTLARWNEAVRKNEDKLFLVLTLLLGALIGLVVTMFLIVTERFTQRLYPDSRAAWRPLVFPVLGSLSMGYLLERFLPHARGSGIPQTKVALFIRGGRIQLRTVLGKFFCSSVSLASGLALGPEGPAVQIGSGIASQAGQKLGFGPARLKQLIPVGASAALAAAFNTPIAAVMFSLEEVMGDLHAPVLGSVVLSAGVSWMVLHLILGDEPLFHVPVYELVHPLEFISYAILGIVGGFVAAAFSKLTLSIRGYCLKQPKWTRVFQPLFGGLVVGVLGFFVPQVLGVGYDFMNVVFNGSVAGLFLLMLCGMKLVATASCVGSGNAGGTFAPSLFLGAMLGGAMGTYSHHLFPHYTATAGAYALVGMGATFAGIVRAPFTSVFMIFELTRDYSIVVPLMLSNMISYYIAWRLQKPSLNEAVARQEGIHLPTRGGLRAARSGPNVALAMQHEIHPYAPDMTVEELLKEAGETDCLVAEEDQVVGVLSRLQVQAAVHEGHGDWTLGAVLAAAGPNHAGGNEDDEAARPSFPHLHEDHGLDVALERMGALGLTMLPVTDRADARRVKGIVTLDDVMHAYGVQ